MSTSYLGDYGQDALFSTITMIDAGVIRLDDSVQYISITGDTVFTQDLEVLGQLTVTGSFQISQLTVPILSSTSAFINNLSTNNISSINVNSTNVNATNANATNVNATNLVISNLNGQAVTNYIRGLFSIVTVDSLPTTKYSYSSSTGVFTFDFNALYGLIDAAFGVDPSINPSTGSWFYDHSGILAFRAGNMASGSIGAFAINTANLISSLSSTYVPQIRTITTGDGLTGGGNLSANRTLAVDSTVVRTTRTLTAGDGLTGGGDLSTNRSFAVDSSVVRNTRQVIAGTGLTGGGALSADVTLTFDSTNALANYVTLNTSQTITGLKTFSPGLNVNASILCTNGTLYEAAGAYNILRGGDNAQRFFLGGGTGDPSNYLDTTGANYFRYSSGNSTAGKAHIRPYSESSEAASYDTFLVQQADAPTIRIVETGLADFSVGIDGNLTRIGASTNLSFYTGKTKNTANYALSAPTLTLAPNNVSVFGSFTSNSDVNLNAQFTSTTNGNRFARNPSYPYALGFSNPTYNIDMQSSNDQLASHVYIVSNTGGSSATFNFENCSGGTHRAQTIIVMNISGLASTIINTWVGNAGGTAYTGILYNTGAYSTLTFTVRVLMITIAEGYVGIVIT